MERIGKKSFSRPTFYFQIFTVILLAVVAVLSMSIACRYAGHSTKLSADFIPMDVLPTAKDWSGILKGIDVIATEHLGARVLDAIPMDVLPFAKDWSGALKGVDVIASEHLGAGVLDVIPMDVLTTAKDWSGTLKRVVKSRGSPLLYGIMGAFLCAVALALNWYKRRVIGGCSKTSLQSVKRIQANMKYCTQGLLMQLSKMQTKGLYVQAVSSCREGKDSM